MSLGYWEKRQAELMTGLDKRDEKFSTKVNKEYQRLLNELEKDISYYYQTYGVEDVLEYRTLMSQLNDAERDSIFKDFDVFVVSHPEYAKLLPVRNNIYKLNRLEGLQMSIRMKTAELGVLENDLMTNHLKSSYEYGYLSTMKHLKNAQSFFNINNPVLEGLLNDKWFNDKNYSDRIWDNKNTLKNWLSSDLKDGIISGKNYNSLIKSLQGRINTGEFYAKRLIWTESAFFMNSANAQAFMDDGILKYQYTSILDSRTSKICQALNNQEFDFKDYTPGVNAPPMHAFCRSTIVPIENKVVNIKKAPYNGNKKKAIKSGGLNKEPKLSNNYLVGEPNYEKWIETLSDTEKRAIKDYTNNSNTFNGILRGIKTFANHDQWPKADQERFVGGGKSIIKALDRYEADQDFTVYRRTSLSKSMPDLIKGETVVIDKGLMSTSFSKEKTNTFAKLDKKNVRFEINVKKGSKVGAYIEKLSEMPEEKEFLIKPSTEFKILDIIDDEKVQIVRMEAK